MTKTAKYYFLIFGLLDLIATGTAFFLSIDEIIFFFSYFTVLSNLLIIFVFLRLGILNPKKTSPTFDSTRAAATLYMTITGIIYWSILVNQHSLALDPWINLTMHGIMPIAAFLSWILFPVKTKLQYKNVFHLLVFPLLFVTYTLIHGPFINWYPYPFFNPVTSGGYLKVFINTAVILFGAWIAGLILVWINNYSKKK